LSIPGAAFRSANWRRLRGLASGASPANDRGQDRFQHATASRGRFFDADECSVPPPDLARKLSRQGGDDEQQASVRRRWLLARSGGGALVQEACTPAAAAQIDLFGRDCRRGYWAVARCDLDGLRSTGFGSVVPPRGTLVAVAGTRSRAGLTRFGVTILPKRQIAVLKIEYRANGSPGCIKTQVRVC